MVVVVVVVEKVVVVVVVVVPVARRRRHLVDPLDVRFGSPKICRDMFSPKVSGSGGPSYRDMFLHPKTIPPEIRDRSCSRFDPTDGGTD